MSLGPVGAGTAPAMRSQAGPRIAGPLTPMTIVLGIVVGATLIAAQPARAQSASATVVAVLGYRGSRLADELRRELESSRFEVLSANLAGRKWQDAARTVDGGRLVRGVAVDENDRTLTVYTRASGRDDIDVRLVLSVDPADRMARRHACLSAVELLHALSESEVESASAGGGPRTASPPGDAAAASASGARSAGSDGFASSPPRPSPTAAAAPRASSSGEVVWPTREGWQLGAGATFGVETNGGPTSHLQFLGRLPATPHLALCLRVAWPLLATQSRDSADEARAWSFGAGVSLQYTLAPRRRWRPYLGLGPGARFGIVELTSTTAAQTTQTFTYSATLGIEAGVRYALAPFVQVFFELAAARAWLMAQRDATGPGHAAANGESAQATVGILFES